jgi:hypothetical protein
MDPEPDPGGPKTYGSNGSGFGLATLVTTMWAYITWIGLIARTGVEFRSGGGTRGSRD